MILGSRLRICQGLARETCLSVFRRDIIRDRREMEVSRENGHLDSWTVRGRSEDERRRRSGHCGVRGWTSRVVRGDRWTDGRERIGGGGGSGFVSHPILVIPSFLTVGWHLYRVTALFLGRPTPSALRKRVWGRFGTFFLDPTSFAGRWANGDAWLNIRYIDREFLCHG